MAENQVLSISGFKNGLITRVPATEIPDDAFSDVQNIELDEKYLPTKSKGHKKYNPAHPIENPAGTGHTVRGGYLYTMTDGSRYYVIASGGKLYYSIVGSGLFTAYQIGGSDVLIAEDSDVEMVQYLNSLWIINGKFPVIDNATFGTSRMIKINGTTVTVLTDANIPQGGKYIIIHQERIFIAGSIDQPNGLYWSEPYAPTNWLPLYGLNYDFVGKDDGEIIAGIKSYQGYVYVGKPHNIYRYATQGDITEWQSGRVDTKFGWLYHRTIQEFFGFLVYLSPDGVAQFNGNNAQLISEQIRDKILALPQMKIENIKRWLLSNTEEFNTGTVPTVCDTSDNIIKEKKIFQSPPSSWEQTSQADWENDAVNLNTKETAGTMKLVTQKIDTDFAGGVHTNTIVIDDKIKLIESSIIQTQSNQTVLIYDNRGTGNSFTITSKQNIKEIIVKCGVLSDPGSVKWKLELYNEAKTLLYTSSEKTESYTLSETRELSFDNINIELNAGIYIFILVSIYSAVYSAIRLQTSDVYSGGVLYSRDEAGVIAPSITSPGSWDCYFKIYFVYFSGNFISREFDTYSANPVAGAFDTVKNVPSGSSISYQIAKYNSGEALSWVAVAEGGTPDLSSKRYFKYKAILTRDAAQDVYVDTVTQNFATTGTWLSIKKELDRVDVYKLPYIFTGENFTLENFILYFRTARSLAGVDTATWYDFTDSNINANALIGNIIWIQLKAVVSAGVGVEALKIEYYKFQTPLTLDHKRVISGTAVNLVFWNSGTGTVILKIKTLELDPVDATWYEVSGWNVLNSPYIIPNNSKQYMRIKAELPSGAVLEGLWCGFHYLSEIKNLGAVPGSWGLFESSYDKKGQTIKWWMRSGNNEFSIKSAQWKEQMPGNTITDTVALNQYIQIKIELNTINYQYQPFVDSVQINYYSGIKYLSPCSVVWKNNYWLNVAEGDSKINNLVYHYNKNGYWLKRTNKKNNIYFIDGDNLLSGTSEKDGLVRQNDIGITDDTDAENTKQIESYFETKNFELMPMIKCFRNLMLNYKADMNFNLNYSVDSGKWWRILCGLSVLEKTFKKTFSGLWLGRFIKFKVENNFADESFAFHFLNLFWTPVRELREDGADVYADYWGWGIWGEEISPEPKQYGGDA